MKKDLISSRREIEEMTMIEMIEIIRKKIKETKMMESIKKDMKRNMK